jgi:hypothetical protein
MAYTVHTSDQVGSSVFSTTEGRLRVVISAIKDIVACPNTLLDPFAVERLLEWVATGQIEPISDEAVRARVDALVKHIDGDGVYTISYPLCRSRSSQPFDVELK